MLKIRIILQVGLLIFVVQSFSYGSVQKVSDYFQPHESLQEFVAAVANLHQLCVDASHHDASAIGNLLEKFDKPFEFTKFIVSCSKSFSRVNGEQWQRAIDGFIGPLAHPQITLWTLEKLYQSMIFAEENRDLETVYKAVNFLLAQLSNHMDSSTRGGRSFEADRMIFKMALFIANQAENSKSLGFKTTFGLISKSHYKLADKNFNLICYILSRPFSEWRYIANEEFNSVSRFLENYKQFYLAGLVIESKHVLVPALGFMSLATSMLVNHPFHRAVSTAVHSSWFMKWGDAMDRRGATISALQENLHWGSEENLTMTASQWAFLKSNFSFDQLVLRYHLPPSSQPSVGALGPDPYKHIPPLDLLANQFIRSHFEKLLKIIKVTKSEFGQWSQEDWLRGVPPGENTINAFYLFMEYIKFLGFSPKASNSTIETFLPLVALGLSCPKPLWDFVYKRETMSNRKLLDIGLKNLFDKFGSFKIKAYDTVTLYSTIENTIRPSWVRDFSLEETLASSEDYKNDSVFARELWDETYWHEFLAAMANETSCEETLQRKQRFQN